jgi:hypothetical protein
MKEPRRFDAEFYAAGIQLAAFHIERGIQDFRGVVIAIARDLERSPEDLLPYLRSWYEGARYACLDLGIDTSRCSSTDEVQEAAASMYDWFTEPVEEFSEPDQLTFDLGTPSEDELRALMGQALTAPTPDAIMSFVGFADRMKGFGPFNVQMIYAQRPGAGKVATRREWADCGRTVRPGAIPIIVLRPMGPIAYVFEELDTDPPIERDPANDAFAATGALASGRLEGLIASLAKPTKRHLAVRVDFKPTGANLAGWIAGRPLRPDAVPFVEKGKKAGSSVWNVSINESLRPAEQFVTLLHELGHLFCGHLGAFADNNLAVDEFGWPDRSYLPHATKEIEAELVAWWLANREGLTTGSPHYLRPYLERAGAAVAEVDLERVTRAVARIRGYLGGKP